MAPGVGVRAVSLPVHAHPISTALIAIAIVASLRPVKSLTHTNLSWTITRPRPNGYGRTSGPEQDLRPNPGGLAAADRARRPRGYWHNGRGTGRTVDPPLRVAIAASIVLAAADRARRPRGYWHNGRGTGRTVDPPLRVANAASIVLAAADRARRPRGYRHNGRGTGRTVDPPLRIAMAPSIVLAAADRARRPRGYWHNGRGTGRLARSRARHWKCRRPARASWVRIPPRPPSSVRRCRARAADRQKRSRSQAWTSGIAR